MIIENIFFVTFIGLFGILIFVQVKLAMDLVMKGENKRPSVMFAATTLQSIGVLGLISNLSSL